jgi:hypothetical protein
MTVWKKNRKISLDNFYKRCVHFLKKLLFKSKKVNRKWTPFTSTLVISERDKKGGRKKKKKKKRFRVDLDAASWTRKGGHHHHHAPIERGIYSPRPFQTLFSSSFLLMNNDVMVSCCSCCSCHATLVSTSLTR